MNEQTLIWFQNIALVLLLKERQMMIYLMDNRTQTEADIELV